MSFTIVGGISMAQEQEEECYPVPPGGCEPEEEEVVCDDVIEAITNEESAEDSPNLDVNGDGVIDEADLPTICTCEQIEDAIAAGDLPESALPEDCVTITTQQDEEEPEEEVAAAPEELADTGINAGSAGLLAVLGVAGGALLLGAARRRT